MAKNLLKVLEGLECILIPHHPGYYTGQFYEPRDDAHLRLIEIYSTWGDSISKDAVTVEVEGAVPVVKVEVYRNGDVIRSEEVSGESFSLTFEDEDMDATILVDAQDESIEFVYYYVSVTHDTGDLAWSSPVWFLHRRR